MERTEINGCTVIHEFKIYYHQWECDGIGWVTSNGKIYTTTIGTLREAKPEELTENITELQTAIKGLQKALELQARRAESFGNI